MGIDSLQHDHPDPPLPDVQHPDDDGDDVLAEEVLRDERVHQAGVAERLAGDCRARKCEINFRVYIFHILF